MSHHQSCKPTDKSLIYKCSQCGLEEPAEHLEDLRAKLFHVTETLREVMDDKDEEVAMRLWAKTVLQSLEEAQ
jgi:hypothetical protein